MATKMNGTPRRVRTCAREAGPTADPDVRDRLNAHARVQAMGDIPAAERGLWQEDAADDFDTLHIALRDFVRRHFPGATAACVVVQPVRGGLPWVMPLDDKRVPQCVDLPGMCSSP